ncbi:MAG: response regulator [Selenomonadaceae bacterium]|nr:response regulator [Selenomonadaceae bacterium]
MDKDRIKYLEEQQKILSEALKQAQHANKAKTTFLNNMSHDIRTPMNAIMGFANLALNHMDNQDLVRDYLSKILTSSKHLLSLINDVLDMSRIESGKVRIEEHECNLSDIMRDLKAIVQSDIKSKRIKFNINTLDVVNEDIFCDKLRLNQVLLNLLSNAFKFTAPGGTISVSIFEKSGAPEGFVNYSFHVKDNGIGMSKEFQKHVFEPFERERSSTVRGIQGTGLGMAIAKNIVNMMNGTIEVKSEEGKGTEFILNFTFRLSSHPRVIGKIEEIEGRKMLIADDDFNTCASLSKMLASIGLRSEWTASGQEAILRTKLALEQEDPFYGFIIDWLMPDLNGIEAVRRIRKLIGNERPIIILTAYDWADVEEEAKSAGVTAFCAKPLFLSDLQNILLRYTKSKEKISEPEQENSFHVEEFEGKKVLLVEDMEMNQILASTILNEMGCEVEIADNGEMALQKVQSADYDVVLMDIQMPVMNGYEAAAAIRSLDGEKFKTIPIVAMTANAFEEDRQRAIESGMNGHLGKPIEIDKLKETLKKAFKGTL